MIHWINGCWNSPIPEWSRTPGAHWRPLAWESIAMALLSRRSFQRYRNGLIHGLFSAKFQKCSLASQRSLFLYPCRWVCGFWLPDCYVWFFCGCSKLSPTSGDAIEPRLSFSTPGLHGRIVWMDSRWREDSVEGHLLVCLSLGGEVFLRQ